MLAIRLARVGAKKQPSFRVVVIEKSRARNGRNIEIVGHYNPTKDPIVLSLNNERIEHWMSHGAQPSDTVRRLLAYKQDGKPMVTTDPKNLPLAAPEKAPEKSAAPRKKAAAKAPEKSTVAVSPEPETAAEPEAETAAKPEAETAAKPEAETGAEPEPETAAKPEAETAAEPEPETAAKPEAETAAEPEAASDVATE